MRAEDKHQKTATIIILQATMATRILRKTTQPHALKAVKRDWAERPQNPAQAHTTTALEVIVTSVAVVTIVFKPHAPLPRAMRRYPFSPHEAPQLFLMIQ